MILHHDVTEEEGGSPLLLILRRSMGLSAGLVRALKAADGLKVDGVSRFTNYLVSPGERVFAHISLAEKVGDNLPEEGPLDVLFEDAGLIAVDKPAGLIVHPSRSKNSGTLSNFVAGYLQKRGEGPGCHIVNRLDRDTSGVVLFAKNAHVKDRASKALREGEKRYTALAVGALSPLEGVIDLPIRRFEARNMRRIVAPEGKRAVTRYHTIAQGVIEGVFCSALELTLETGRTHQIRVHCLHQGAPLVGDGLYYTEASRLFSEKLGIGRQLLHSGHLAFCHPLTGERVEIAAPILDGDFLGMLEKLGGMGQCS